ncbi:hypothetical protein ACFY7Z_19265 [Streptomyces sp. NPDC012623]|uniref:hypothetical protein n=1 Tax=unclassified Streptomyces TaxID=2593676 RepID=UPI00368D7CD8
MRQLSAPGRRLAVWIASSLAVAASAGCMSVGEGGGEPAPSRSPDRGGAAAEPDGETAAGVGTGVPHFGQGRTGPGGAAEHSGAYAEAGGGSERAAGKGGEDGKGGKDASPEASSPATASPEPSRGSRPHPGRPTPPREDPVPTKEPTRTAPPPTQQPPQTQDPEPEPEPETKTPDPPTASPAAEVRTGAAPDGVWAWKEPRASPQTGPV